MKRILHAIFALTLLVSAGCYTNPVTGRKYLVGMPQERELALGQQSFSEVKRTTKISTEPTANARVQRVGKRIAEAVGDQLPSAQWEFVVFESKDVNAFALPGGKVGVYTGLLQLAESDSELAIVMGHEIGHVIARHGAERMAKGIGVAVVGVAGAIILDNKTDPQTRNLILGAYGVGAVGLVMLPFSRADESEADHMGVVYAARAGYDPRAAIGFWQKMSAQNQMAGKSGGKLAELASTHPSDATRMADLQKLMPEVVPIYEANHGKYGP